MFKDLIIQWIDQHSKELTDMAKKIWENPEISSQEFYASNLQKDYLKNQGFTIIEYADIPTAFMAEYGSGQPIVGLLGEYDALKNLSQAASPILKVIEEGGAGHGCGHNLLGVGCLGSAVAIKSLMEQQKLPGTIRYYGCPAEETVLGKVHMAEQGAFDDLDAAITWHPSSFTMPWAGSLLSVRSAKFAFTGKSAHAGSAPHMGRSALDAVELMNVGANYMREHVEEQNRIHYIITKGGYEPNTVPAEAEVWYNVRAPKRAIADETFSWLISIAKGAAMMTQTSLSSVDIISGTHEVLPNQTMVERIGQHMQALGGPAFTDEDRAFAKTISQAFDESQKEKGLQSNFIPLSFMDHFLHEGVSRPLDAGQSLKASTDVGDVSWITPLAMFGVATWPLGTAAHTWQTTAASGSDIGFHAMHYASKVMALTLADLLTDQELLAEVKEEFAKSTKGYKYTSVFEQYSEV